jgi:hypothetical protein
MGASYFHTLVRDSIIQGTLTLIERALLRVVLLQDHTGFHLVISTNTTRERFFFPERNTKLEKIINLLKGLAGAVVVGVEWDFQKVHFRRFMIK